MTNKFINNFLLWGIIISVCILVVLYIDPSSKNKEILYNEFKLLLADKVSTQNSYYSDESTLSA